MFKAALGGVLRSPVAFFDTTPIRIFLYEISHRRLTPGLLRPDFIPSFKGSRHNRYRIDHVDDAGTHSVFCVSSLQNLITPLSFYRHSVLSWVR